MAVGPSFHRGTRQVSSVQAGCLAVSGNTVHAPRGRLKLSRTARGARVGPETTQRPVSELLGGDFGCFAATVSRALRQRLCSETRITCACGGAYIHVR